eukprot:GHVU01212431.1.p1 GENE.GHVU01212431.1~~GHVU01212431.1.p1  ORF type:complete len:124 (+),score=23.98 GHVU01212431.1:174-545(+)
MAAEQSSKAGFTPPDSSESLKKKQAEHQERQGTPLTCTLRLPDGTEETFEWLPDIGLSWSYFQVMSSSEVGYVKLLLCQKKDLDGQKVLLEHGGKTLMDPLSLCDCPGIASPKATLDVKIIER